MMLTAPEAAEVVGIPVRTLQRWVVLGIVMPERPPRGSGSQMGLGEVDLIVAHTVARLRNSEPAEAGASGGLTATLARLASAVYSAPDARWIVLPPRGAGLPVWTAQEVAEAALRGNGVSRVVLVGAGIPGATVQGMSEADR